MDPADIPSDWSRRRRKPQDPRPPPPQECEGSNKKRKKPEAPLPPPPSHPPRLPVIRHETDRKIIIDSSDFAALVQRLTGWDSSSNSSMNNSPPTTSSSSGVAAASQENSSGPISPADSPDGRSNAQVLDGNVEGLQAGSDIQRTTEQSSAGISSQNQDTLPPIPPSFFYPPPTPLNFFSPPSTPPNFYSHHPLYDYNPLNFPQEFGPVLHSYRDFLDNNLILPPPPSFISDLIDNFIYLTPPTFNNPPQVSPSDLYRSPFELNKEQKRD